MSSTFWSRRQLLAALALALLASFAVLSELWAGRQVIGGDTMTYFFPQKTYLSHHLARGDLPLWNNLTGHGYPFVADSQIAMWHPLTIPLYSLLSVNGAFNANQLIHYVVAFLGMWAYGRAAGLRPPGALLAGLVFTYGWFPSRLTVEWAVTTGSLLPWGLLGVEAFLRTGRRRWLALLIAVLTVQLLAGHFSLTFITHVTLACYAALRLFVWRRVGDQGAHRRRHEPEASASPEQTPTANSSRGTTPVSAAAPSDSMPPSVEHAEATEADASGSLTNRSTLSPPLLFLTLLACQLVAFPMAACQLAPTWELRQQSERGGLPIPDVDYGRVPWQYLSQLVAPWHVYSSVDPNSFGGADTNDPAAHLFLGTLPLWLAVLGFRRTWRRSRVARLWLPLMGIGLMFAVGWVTPIYQHVPGFGYFKVPGRYGLVVTVGGALLAGWGFQRMLARVRMFGERSLVLLAAVAVSAATALEFDWVARAATMVTIVPASVVDEGFDGPFATTLREQVGPGQRPRVHGAGQNTLNIPGLAKTPCYLGLMPLRYLAGGTAYPGDVPPDTPLTASQLDRLRDAGVTHLLLLDDGVAATWPGGTMRALQVAVNVPFGRTEPFHVAELSGGRQRVALEEGEGTASLTRYEPDVVEAETDSQTGGTVVLTDLAFPGWSVTVDGAPAEPLVIDETFRGVRVPAGRHRVRWEYRPASVRTGWIISLGTLVLVAGVFIFVRRRATTDT